MWLYYDMDMNMKASFDESTATYSYTTFVDLVNKFLDKRLRQGMLLIDLDDLKFISRIKSKAISDVIVTLIVRNIYNSIPKNTIVGRLSEETFAVFLPDVQYESELRLIGERLVAVHKAPISYNMDNYMCTLTIGGMQTGRIKLHDLNAETMLEHAEIAQRQAKQNGKNQYIELNNEYLESINRKSYVLTLLKETLYNKKFYLKFQPFFNMKTGKLIGFETLCRLRDPKGDDITPTEFIRIAEENNIIFDVDFAVVEHVCQLLYNQVNIDLKGLISVNISPITFMHPLFISTMKDIVDRYSIPPNFLAIELIETAFIESYVKARENITALSELGIKILLDDFGAGYSNLKSVLELNVSILKIDKSLIDNIHEIRANFIVKKAVEIAELFNMDIVAEGVETRSQFEALKQMNIKAGQGFYLGRPMSEEQFIYHLGRKDIFEDSLL